VSTTTEPRSRRRLAALLVAAPLALAAAYALAYRFVGDRPTLDAMVPDDAVLVWRFRDAAAYDALRTPPETPGASYAAASRALGAEINLPELPGIDRSRPLLEVKLDPARRVDPRYWVLPVADASAVARAFRDPDLAERHAKRVDVHGDWAAASTDFYAAKRAGHGSRTLPPARGERWMVVAPDWTAFVDAMLRPSEAGEAPTTGILAALGFDVARARRVETPDGVAFQVPGGRVPFVRVGWSAVTVYGFDDRVRAELVAAAPDLLAALAAAKAGPEGDASPAPERVEASIEVAPRGRRAVALALGYAGLPWPPLSVRDGFAALRLDPPAPLSAWAEMIPGAFPGWVLVLRAPKGFLPDLAAFDLPLPEAGTSTPLAAAPSITMPYGPVAGPAEVARRAAADGSEVVAIGPAASALAERRAAEPAASAARPAARDGGHVLLARFRLSASAATRVLGRAIGRGGILSPLQGAEIEGELTTDGKTVVLEARRAK